MSRRWWPWWLEARGGVAGEGGGREGRDARSIDCPAWPRRGCLPNGPGKGKRGGRGAQGWWMTGKSWEGAGRMRMAPSGLPAVVCVGGGGGQRPQASCCGERGQGPAGGGKKRVELDRKSCCGEDGEGREEDGGEEEEGGVTVVLVRGSNRWQGEGALAPEEPRVDMACAAHEGRLLRQTTQARPLLAGFSRVGQVLVPGSTGSTARSSLDVRHPP